MTALLYEKRGRVARMTLNRPQAHNALSPELVAELEAAVADAGADGELRALVVRGAGPSFCDGADLKFIRERGLADPAGRWHRTWRGSTGPCSPWRPSLWPQWRWCMATAWPAGWS